MTTPSTVSVARPSTPASPLFHPTPGEQGGDATDFLTELVPGLRWRVLLDIELPLAPQPKQRGRAARVGAAADTSSAVASLAAARGAPNVATTVAVRGGLGTQLRPASDAGHGESLIVFTPAETRIWTDKASVILGAHFRAAGHVQPHRHRPVRVDAAFYFSPPGSPLHPVFPVVRPDRDNLDKIVLDSLVAARVLADDAQVVAGTPLKLYAAPGTSPRVRVRLSVLED